MLRLLAVLALLLGARRTVPILITAAAIYGAIQLAQLLLADAGARSLDILPFVALLASMGLLARTR